MRKNPAKKLGAAFDEERCLSCPASLPCVTGILEEAISECAECGNLVGVLDIEYPDSFWDPRVPGYRVAAQYSGEIYIPKWCPRAEVTLEVTCDRCNAKLNGTATV